MDNEKILDISWGTIFKIAIAFLCFYLLYLIKDILILFLFSLIISLLFNPAIDFLNKRRVPRVLATISVYLFAFGLLGFFIYSIVPLFSAEIEQFSQLFPQYFEKISPFMKSLGIEAFESFESFTKAFQEGLVRASSTIFSAISAFFGGIFSAFAILTFAVFLSLEEKSIERVIAAISPKKYEAYLLDLFLKSEKKVAAWFGTRILSCLFIGVASFIALRIFDIDYAFALSMFGGISNIVPFIGPVLAGILIALIAALDSLWKAVLVLAAFILIQQIEGSIISPLLTRKFVGLPAVLVLLSLMIGGKLLGILGAILAIPLAGILYEIFRDFLKKRKEERPVIS